MQLLNNSSIEVRVGACQILKCVIPSEDPALRERPGVGREHAVSESRPALERSEGNLHFLKPDTCRLKP